MSGSMCDANAVMGQTMAGIGNNFAGNPGIQFAIVLVPGNRDREPEILMDFSDGMLLALMGAPLGCSNGGQEPTFDSLYQASNGTMGLAWPSNAQVVHVLITDERGQTYEFPSISETMVADQLVLTDQIFFLFDGDPGNPAVRNSFDEIVMRTGGQRFELDDALDLFNQLDLIFVSCTP
jgi:hypothetical protein